MRIAVDDRELRGPMLAALEACDRFEIATERLRLGDYRVNDALLFERKTLTDLVQSIKEGRLFSQALRLSRAKFPTALILEGRAKDLAGSQMRWEAIQGALINVALFIGIPILRTRCASETVQTMLYAGRQQAAIAANALPRRGFRPKGRPALQRHIMQGLPGVGPGRAERLMQRFGSIESALTADSKMLMDVPGIGAQTARRIRWAVEEAGARYG